MKLVQYDKQLLEAMDSRFRASFLNSLNGYKTACLAGTCNQEGQTNLAIFNSVTHIGANPALIGLLFRPETEFSHTFKNLKEQQEITLNNVLINFIEKAHQTSAKYPETISEFDACSFTPCYSNLLKAPYVAESNIRIGLKLEEMIPIKLNNTTLAICSVMEIYLPENCMEPDGNIRHDLAGSMASVGLNSYYQASFQEKFPYASRPKENTTG